MSRPDWLLPKGVSRALWEYTQQPEIATGYDSSISNSGLTQFDLEFLRQQFIQPGRLIDLGCGTGRHAVDFAARGFDVLGLDLSTSMLREARRKAALVTSQDLALLCANLCQLEGLKESCFDYALLMYATLGMIPGADDRQSILHQVNRILKPGGRLALHVHNLWFNLLDPQGRQWLIGDRCRAWFLGRPGGTRSVHDRGIPNFQMHVFTWRELKRLLRVAGFRVAVCQPLNATASGPLTSARFLGGVRANGWLIVAEKAKPRC